jgi:hypothetical protein
MLDPINPEDHRIGVYDGEAAEALDYRYSFEGWRMGALAEAIHQTFERDVAAVARHALLLANYDTFEGEEESDTFGPLKRAKGSRMRRPNYSPPEQTGYEIDRLARLIVDGEYRRRKNQSQED